MDKVNKKLKNAKHYHFAYCDKAAIQLDSEDVKTYITDIIDAATYCADECMIFIEEYEFNKSEKEKHLLNATVRKEKKEERDTQYKHLSSEIKTEEVFAKEITGKIDVIVRQQD